MDEILKDVYTWSVFSEEKKLDFNGYFILTQHALFGNAVIDPPPVSDLDLAQMETLGSVQQILITNRNHIRWSRELQEKFDAEIRMNSADAQFGSKGKHSPWMEFEDLIKRDPDVIIVMPCGYNIDKTKREMGTLRKLSEWDNLKAVQNSDVYLTDGNQYFNRPGPRLVESLEILMEILYADKFDFGHKNTGWRKYI